MSVAGRSNPDERNWKRDVAIESPPGYGFRPRHRNCLITFIKIRGARTHKLKNISLDLPRNRLTVITGLSGWGKSLLEFDTLCMPRASAGTPHCPDHDLPLAANRKGEQLDLFPDLRCGRGVRVAGLCVPAYRPCHSHG